MPNMLYRKKTQGFTLLEVLIALLIASVGLLGIAGLVLHSMRASFESGLQTTAAILSLDVHERAWLSSHLATTNACRQDWVVPDVFAPGRDWDALGLNAVVAPPDGSTYPECELTISWNPATTGVVGGMATFGGMYTHRFTIPSVQ